MSVATYDLGHKNPDSDAICAAIGYTALLHLQGRPEAVAARRGVLRRETACILERFGVAAPLLVTDLRPRVADVITGPAVSVHQDTPLYEVGQILQRANIRAVPVVDDANHHVVGVIDHHRVADFQTRTPPFLRLEPVGATSTIVAKLCAEAAVPIPAPIAGVLLAGILADTLLFRGPTTTAEDRHSMEQRWWSNRALRATGRAPP